ncbi:hypothetical protein PHMEG_00035906, partial [Phytophthora megakarya]
MMEKSEWMNVLIRRCQVERKNLIFMESSIHTSSCGRTLLELRFVRGFLEDGIISTGLGQFLRLIGDSLKSLTLAGLTTQLDVNEILESCPHLEELKLCGGLIDVHLDFSEYRAKHVPVPPLNCNWDDIAAICCCMCARSLGQCVGRLHMHVSLGRDENPDVNIIENFGLMLAMLRINRTLEYLAGQLRSNRYFDAFRLHHLKLINRTLKLETPIKLAILSATTSRETQRSKTNKRKQCLLSNTQSAMNRLNHHVLANVFSFATPQLFVKYIARQNNSRCQ